MIESGLETLIAIGLPSPETLAERNDFITGTISADWNTKLAQWLQKIFFIYPECIRYGSNTLYESDMGNSRLEKLVVM